MSLYHFDFLQVWIIKVVDPNVTIPITGSHVSTVMRHSEAADGLLNILRLSKQNIFVCNIQALLISINGLSLKNFKVLFQELITVANKNNFRHVFAVSISEKALLNLCSFVGGNRAIVNKVPKPY
jgi:hypothetical protein